jgi:hypothetical protein
LRFEFQLAAGANSGVALRAVPGEKHPKDSALPHHLEVQILDDGGRRKPSGSIPYPTGSLFWAADDSYLRPDRLADLKPLGSWNEMTIEARGASLQVWVNGRRVLSTDLEQLSNQSNALPGLQRPSGRIGFQRHTGAVRFRDIEIKEFPPSEKVGVKPGRLLTGKGLTGWTVEGDEDRFRMEDDVLVATSPDWRSRSYLLSDEQHADCRLRFECRLEKGANCGVVVRGYKGERSDWERPGAIDHPIIKLTDPGAYPGLPPGGSHWVASGKHEGPEPRAVPFPIREWNAVEIEVRGTACRVWINKELAVRLSLDEDDRSGQLLAGLARERGHIGFQANTGTARFRNVEVEVLPSDPFFTGADLTGWKGLPGYWRVEDGAIIGACPRGRPAHTFLVSEKAYRDFDLRFEARRLDGVGNSGVQFRSRIQDTGQLTVVGPQCEIDSADHSFPPGSLLTEPDCKPLAEKAPRAAVAARYRDADFNQFHIRCVGKHVTIRVNGVTAIDDDYPDLPAEGVIAWQLHGERTPREVTFRNIEFTDLSAPDKGEAARRPGPSKLLAELAVLDREPPPAGAADARAAAHHLKRADLLERVVALVPPEERESWIRQLADSLSAACRCSPADDPAARKRLAGLRQQVVRAARGGALAAFVTYRELLTDYSVQMGQPKADLTRLQTEWAGRLAAFVEAYPNADDTPEALLQLGMVSEFLNKETEAESWYARLGKAFPDTPQGTKGAGAVRRLELAGRRLKLVGPTLADPDTTFDVSRLRGKVVVVYYWASWNTQTVSDFARLRALAAADKEVVPVLVNLDGTPEEARAFLKKTPAPGVVLHAPGGLEGKLAADYGILTLPTAFLVGTDGKVINRSVRVSDLEEESKRWPQ